ncbi:uncharacterized protein LAESUDRAFT_463559 [Laetiporus sulphureus 93-53]|uniref:Uncharacterized protein n=1 Tax=Laetiporus sulphureus 93-53 TaxID=1314785 RepID=A0A165G659_9APHY|nr:uncharacterized protein LAESUDRAFT_463559 [Laetiporus sulphureus 93-53]KZT09878.1 hypothetical protein LAESUDRAFT_463559 [Laetiporus sulphureus 93-53]
MSVHLIMTSLISRYTTRRRSFHHGTSSQPQNASAEIYAYIVHVKREHGCEGAAHEQWSQRFARSARSLRRSGKASGFQLQAQGSSTHCPHRRVGAEKLWKCAAVSDDARCSYARSKLDATRCANVLPPSLTYAWHGTRRCAKPNHPLHPPFHARAGSTLPICGDRRARCHLWVLAHRTRRAHIVTHSCHALSRERGITGKSVACAFEGSARSRRSSVVRDDDGAAARIRIGKLNFEHRLVAKGTLGQMHI